YRQIIVLGLDNSSLVGAPEMILGDISDLSSPDSILMDDAGFGEMWPGEPLSLGKTFEMNDHRAIIVGICKTSRTFQTFPVVYTRYSQAVNYSPTERKFLSFILAQPQQGHTTKEVCDAITAQTGLKAMSREDFMDVTENYFLRKTGIP